MQRLTTRGQATNAAIVNREEFTTSGALSATYGASGHTTGSLPSGWAAEFWQTRDGLARDGRVSDFYVVYSYSTPIAWYNPLTERWTIPAVKYSVTTSKHQGNLYGLGDVRRTLPEPATV